MPDNIVQSRKPTIMVKPSRLVCPESLERRCAVTPVRCSVGLKIVNADLIWRMHVPTRLGEQRWHMAASTIGLAIKENFAASCCRFVEATLGRLWRRDRELIKMQCSKLRGDEIRIVANVSETGGGRNGELCRIV